MDNCSVAIPVFKLATSCNENFVIISIDFGLQHSCSWRVRIIQIFHCPICSKYRFLQPQPAIKLCNILHLQQYATKSKKTVSGLIEPALSNGNGPRFSWTTVSTLIPVATSHNAERSLFSFFSEWSLFKHMLSCSFSSRFSVLESASEMLFQIYLGCSNCNTLQCFATN